MPEPFDIQTDYNNTEFTPGDTLSGTLTWNLPGGTESIALRLFWFTSGRGSQDIESVDELTWPISPTRLQGHEKFSFTLPTEPYSFSGKIISLTWALEAVAMPEETSTKKEFTLTPNGQEIVLPSITEPKAKKQKSKWFQPNR